MSPSPLPALRTVSPASATSPPMVEPAGQHTDGTAFHAHLHDAQRPPSRTSDTSDNRSSNAKPATGKNATSSTSASGAGSAKTTVGASAQDGTADGIDAGPTSLASQVLGLIDQSSGGDANTTAASNATSTDGKTVPGNKTPPQDDAGKPALPSAVAPTAALLAPLAPLPAVADAQGAARGNSGAAAATAAAAAAASLAIATTVGLAPGKSPGAFSGTDDADADDVSGAGAGTGNAASNVLVSGTDINAPASAGSLVDATHNTLLAGMTASTAAGQASDTGDLAALRSMLAPPVLAAPATIGNATSHNLSIKAPLGSPGFAQELGQQVTWLGGQDIKQAQIRLNPQDLGPLEVKVSVEHGRVDVVFSAQHPAAVAAVQQSLDQLNQMLGGHGLSLGQATVGQQAAQQQFGHPHRQTSPAAATIDAEPIDAAAAATLSQPLAMGLVDAFA